MSAVVILDHVGPREAAALMQDGQVTDLLVDTDLPRPGTIYRAIADRPMKGQGGMFLRTPDGTAFLRQIRGLAPGQPVLVQVTGFAEPGKAIPVTAKLLFKSRYAIVTPAAPGLNVSRQIRDDALRDTLLEIAHEVMGGDAMGLILRSSCAEAGAEEIAEDIAQMVAVARAVQGDADGREAEKLVEGDGPHALAWRDWTMPAQVLAEPGGFEREGVADVLDALGAPRVALGAQASMFIEPTRALVAVDVNTGGDTSPAAGLKANLAAMRELPRQLRLRGLGGQIVIDAAPSPKKDRRQIETELRRALKADGVETTLVGWTALGHIELQRKRDRVPLSEVIR